MEQEIVNLSEVTPTQSLSRVHFAAVKRMVPPIKALTRKEESLLNKIADLQAQLTSVRDEKALLENNCNTMCKGNYKHIIETNNLQNVSEAATLAAELPDTVGELPEVEVHGNEVIPAQDDLLEGVFNEEPITDSADEVYSTASAGFDGFQQFSVNQ